ncbi:MAG: hypothetical protein M0018_04570 [Nitrospiraceae bacterium]|nr:hypothetical protein [Nitrospiraceae bacterium]
MPIYEYQCTACGQKTEALQKFSDAPLERCNACGGKLKKLLSNTSFVLKGTGWYATDFARKDKPTGASPKKPSASKETTSGGSQADSSSCTGCAKKETKPAG